MTVKKVISYADIDRSLEPLKVQSVRGTRLQHLLVKYIEDLGKGMIIKLETSSKVGFPNLMFLYKGRTLFLEVKGWHDRTSHQQSRLFQHLRMLDFKMYIITFCDSGVTCLDEFIKDADMLDEGYGEESDKCGSFRADKKEEKTNDS